MGMKAPQFKPPTPQPRRSPTTSLPPFSVMDLYQIEDQQSRRELESSSEYKALKSAEQQIRKLMTDEVGSYQRKYVQAMEQFGRDSPEARNAMEGLELAAKGARRKSSNEIPEDEKARETCHNSDAAKQYNLIRQERDRIRE